jgi:hypothetical protein
MILITGRLVRALQILATVVVFVLTKNYLYAPSEVHLYGHPSAAWWVKSNNQSFGNTGASEALLNSVSKNAMDSSDLNNKILYGNAMMAFVHNDTFHCKYYQTHNKVHYLASLLLPILFKEYGLIDWRYFQCGFCHQRNLLLTRILNASGFDAKLIGLDGHVITEITIEKEKYWVDADYGVNIFKKPLEVEVERVVREAYSSTRFTNNKETPELKKRKFDQLIKAYQDYSNDSYYDLTFMRWLEKSQRIALNVIGLSISLLVSIFFFFCLNYGVTALRKKGG